MTQKRAVTESQKIASLIDHTLLKPDATRQDVVALCEEARQHEFASVCVHPARVKLAARVLSGSAVKTGTVVGFPFGASTHKTKAFETADAIREGAQEIDMTIALGALKDRDYDAVRTDIRAVVKAAGACVVKVILETALLSDKEKRAACKIVVEAGAHFVKTSSGFAGGGATEKDIRLMRKAVGKTFGVKASGGIQTLKDAVKMVAAGANRIGSSSSVRIVSGRG